MTKRTAYLSSAAVALMLMVPAAVRGQEARDQRRPVTRPSAAAPAAMPDTAKRETTSAPVKAVGPAARESVTVEHRRVPARRPDLAARLRRRRPQR